MKKLLGMTFCLMIIFAVFGTDILLAQEEAAQEEEIFEYDDHGKRDPFWKLVSPSGGILSYDKDLMLSDMVLEGIITGENGDNIAIVNGNIVKPHDTVGAFVIERIETNSIVIQKGEERYTLKLKKEE